MDEMNITPFSSSRPQRLFEAVAWSESTIGLLQRNNIFNEATSSRFPQLSMQRAPHDVITPPHPPSLGSKLRVPESSGEPPALSLYRYYIYIHAYIYIYLYIVLNVKPSNLNPLSIVSNLLTSWSTKPTLETSLIGQICPLNVMMSCCHVKLPLARQWV